MSDERESVLPSIPLPKNSVEIAGKTIEFRSLSRTETLKLTTQFKEDADGAEIFLLMCGVGVTEDEAKSWRDETDPFSAGKLIDGIIILSGLGTNNPKD